VSLSPSTTSPTGALGGILVGFFATSAVNGPADGVFYTSSDEGWKQLGLQVYGLVVCAGWSGLISLLLLLGIDQVMGLRVTEAEEGE
jgi:ammonia channel protein AmtB